MCIRRAKKRLSADDGMHKTICKDSGQKKRKKAIVSRSMMKTIKRRKNATGHVKDDSQQSM